MILYCYKHCSMWYNQGFCLAVITDHFVPQVGSSELKRMIKYQTMSLSVSNAGWFKQATAYTSHLTSHSLLWNNNVPALSKWHLRNDMKQFTSLNTLNWYCVECTCFGISSSGSATSPNSSEAVRSSYTAMHTHSCFIIFRFMARWHTSQSRSFCFAVSA